MNDLSDYKIPPYSLESEQAVIGGMLLDNTRIDTVVEILSAADFYREDHRSIAECVFKLHAQNKPADLFTVQERLEAQGSLENVGGVVYLGTLAKDTPSAANIKAYADIVRENALRRESIALLNESIESAFDGSVPISESLDEVQTKLMLLTNRTDRTGAEHCKQGLNQALQEIDAAFNSNGELTGLSTSLDIIDRYTNGLQKQNLIIVAGRPSMGKTALAMQWSLAAAQQNKSVLFFSMEMSSSEIGKRNMANVGDVEFKKMARGNLDDNDWPKLTSALSQLAKSNFFIDESPCLSLAQIRARSRKMKRQNGLDMIVIDYLQLMQMPKGSDNLAARVGEVTRGLKALAKEMDCPVVCLSQLNRAVESRGDKRPMMSDLRESGAIEQDADLIFFVYRDEVYVKDSPLNKNIAELVLAKNRQGKTGNLYVNCFLEKMQFRNYNDEIPPEYTTVKRVAKIGGLS